MDLDSSEAELLINQVEQLESQAAEVNQQLRAGLAERGGLAL
jgi:hypothetical protein